jgi:hypothetical protein
LAVRSNELDRFARKLADGIWTELDQFVGRTQKLKAFSHLEVCGGPTKQRQNVSLRHKPTL